MDAYRRLCLMQILPQTCISLRSPARGKQSAHSDTVIFLYTKRGIQRRSDARGETGDNEVMINDLVGDYNTNGQRVFHQGENVR